MWSTSNIPDFQQGMDRRAFLKASGVLVVFIGSLADDINAQTEPTPAPAAPAGKS